MRILHAINKVNVGPLLLGYDIIRVSFSLELRNDIYKSAITNVIDDMIPDDVVGEAMRLSLAKWIVIYQVVSENPDRPISFLVQESCPLCILFNNVYRRCVGCPIFEDKMKCGADRRFCVHTPLELAAEAARMRQQGLRQLSSSNYYTKSARMTFIWSEVSFLAGIAFKNSMIDEEELNFILALEQK